MSNKKSHKTLRIQPKQTRGSASPFLDLTDMGTYKRLTKKQKFYIEEYNRMYGADLLAQTQDYYDMLPKEIQRSVRYTQQKVLSGRSYREAQSTYLDNYATGLENNGRSNLANFLRQITRSKRGQLQRQALIDSLVNLDLYYGRTQEANSKIGSEQVNDAIAQSAVAMIQYALENNINVIGKNMTMNDIRELMDTGYIEDDLLNDIRNQMINNENYTKDTLEEINSWLGLEEDDTEVQ